MQNALEWKDLFALFSLIGEAYAFTVKHSGATLITIGILAALSAIVWGALKSRNHGDFLKVVAILFVILGIVGVLFFGSVAVVVNAGERPASGGIKSVQKSAEIIMTGQGTTAEIAHSYKLEFVEGEHVTVRFMPATESRSSIKTLQVVNVHGVPQGQAGRLINIENGEREVAYELKDPSPAFTAVLDFNLKLDRVKSQPREKVLVTYQYDHKPLHWRLSKWVFDHFGA